MNDRRSVASLDAVLLPDQFRLAVFDLRRIEANDPTLLVAFGILFAMADVHKVAVHHRRAVDRGGAEVVAPDRFAGVRLHGVDTAVGTAADDQPLAVDRRGDR